MYKLKIKCDSNITITNCAEFTLELKQYIGLFFNKVRQLHPMNDDRYEYLVEHFTDEFLLLEINECNRFGLKLLFDDVSKDRALQYIKKAMAISKQCSVDSTSDESSTSDEEPSTSGEMPSPVADDPGTESS